MANVIDDLKIELGTCIRVYNVEKKEYPCKYKSDEAEYLAIQVEAFEGDEERCILMTHIEHTDAATVELSFAVNMVFGRLYPVIINRKRLYLCKVKHWNGNVRIIRFTQKLLDKCDIRAKKHPKSCTKKSWLTDMMD